MLNQIYTALLPHTITSAALTSELQALLLQHRAKCLGSQSQLMPPPVAISQAQVAAGAGPVSAVANQADTGYNRKHKRRKVIAQSKDPSCYSVHKQAAVNGDVTCLCGTVYTNEKHQAAKHRRTPVHKTWLEGYWASQAGQAQSSQVPCGNGNAEDGEDEDAASLNEDSDKDGQDEEAGCSEDAAVPAEAGDQRGDDAAVASGPEADWSKMTFDQAAQALDLLQLDDNIVAWRLAHNFMRMPVL
jgi:hypothetical protein